MEETYYLGSYWLARPESAESCAQRAERFFRFLEHCDPSWSRWTDTAASQTEQNPLVSPDAAAFARMFGREENQQGAEGFDFHLFAGDTVPTATAVNGSCGSATLAYPQTCVLKLPIQGPVAERVLTAPVMTAVLRAMALAWEPEWAVAASHQHRDTVSEKGKPGTFVGWVTYFSRRRGTVPPLPAPVRAETVEDKGTLLILTPERFTASNPEHVAMATRVRELLNVAGLLGPLQPLADRLTAYDVRADPK